MIATKTSITSKLLITCANLFLFLSVLSCKTEIKYKHLEDFKLYLNEIHKINTNEIENSIYYIIPIANSCDSCIKSNLNLLSTLHTDSKLKPILVGENHENNNIEIIEIILNKFPTTKIDKKEEIYTFQTGFGKPIIVHIKNGSCLFFLEVTDFKIDEAKKYLEK